MGDNGRREVLLEDVAAEITVGHVGPMASEYVFAGIPFLRSQNVEPFRINLQDIKYIADDFHERLRKSALVPGDVVIVRTGRPGAAAIIPDCLQTANCSDLVIVRPGPLLDARFLAYYVNSAAAHHINSHLVGAVQQHFNVGSARKMRLWLPPLPEQQAIAHILSTLDDKIELNRRMNETLEAMARALFKSWFVDFEPARAKAEGRDLGLPKPVADLFPDRFQDSELGEIPEGWRVVRIEEIAKRVAMGPFGSRITRDNFVDYGVPVIRGNNLTDGFNEYGFVYLSEIKANELSSANAFPGDIVFTHRGTLGQVGLIPQGAMYDRYVVSQSQMLLTVEKNLVSQHLVYRFFRSCQGQHALLANMSTTGVPAIARPVTSLRAVKMIFPTKALSDQFDLFVHHLELRQHANSRENDTLSQLRDALLPKLLSGEIRVNDARMFAEDVV